MSRPMPRIALMAAAIVVVGLGALHPLSPVSSYAGEGASPLKLREAGGEESAICFWSAQGPVCLDRHAESRPAGQAPEAMLAALLEGPDAEERSRGLWSAIPEGTTLAELRDRPDGTVIVRLAVPPAVLDDLDHGTFEIIVQQIGMTLRPLNWRDLRIQTRDPATGTFVPLAEFLPEIPPPRKETVLGGEEEPAVGPAHAGQPPAQGQGQPQGALSGKTVYVSAGHGWEWRCDQWDARSNCTRYRWRTQRLPYPAAPYQGPIIEDHNNAEAVNQYLLQYLWNAGAMVWPVRERDMNSEMAVVDNDHPAPGTGYVETGEWTAASGTGYAGGGHRRASTVVGAPTATATWTATLPADGHYAVYVWYRPGSGRAPDARYTVHHAGGETTVTVDQRHHGLTWHYIGTYGLQAGEEPRVTLTNQSAFADRVVDADAVRFGGGAFDDLTGIDTDATSAPNKPWWEVAAYYQVQRMGMVPGSYFNDVVARPMYARWEHAGTGDDAVYVSWHTNGYSGYQWDFSGTVSYIYNGETKPVTPGSADLQRAIHNEIIQDIQAGWDSEWRDLGRKSWVHGEVRELWDPDLDPSERQIPGALFEIAFHDHPDDTDALKEPTFNMLAARAMYQGIVKYFEQRDGVDLTLLPEPPTHLAVQNLGGGAVRASWEPSPTDTLDLAGDAAAGYRVYTSTNGIGWSNGIPVTGTTAYTLTDLSPGQLIFVRVTATNEGGESFPTETLAVRAGDRAEILLVNGFDRLNNTMLVPDDDPVEGPNMRMFLDQMNRYDYVIQHAEVISYPFDSASNEAVQSGQASLSDYALVDWILGEESAPDETLDATERALLRNFLASGGALFISGTEIGWHLDYVGADPAFYNDVLRADYVSDGAGTYDVVPITGSIFDGLGSFRFDAPGMYDPDWPDVIRPTNGSRAALVYEGRTGDTAAAIQYENGCERLVTFGFPFETVWPSDRPDVMARALDFLDECVALPIATRILSPVDGSAHKAGPPFQGTAEAHNATLDRVEVQVQRAADGHCWTGSAWAPGSSWWLRAEGIEDWSYNLAPALDADGDYRLRARAWTTDGVSDTLPAEVDFTYDTTAPTTTTLITPTGGITITAVRVRLAWEPLAPDGGSSLAYEVRLDGQHYTVTKPVYTATRVAEGPHSWGVQVFDAAGNRSDWVTDTFSVRQRHTWLPLVLRDYWEEPAPCTNLIDNGGFEYDSAWEVLDTSYHAGYSTSMAHGGSRSMRVGIPAGLSGGGEQTYSAVAQMVTVPSHCTATLRYWVYPVYEDADLGDLQYVWVVDSDDEIHFIHTSRDNLSGWLEHELDLSEFAGQTISLRFSVMNDGDDDTAAMYVDDVVLEVCP